MAKPNENENENPVDEQIKDVANEVVDTGAEEAAEGTEEAGTEEAGDDRPEVNYKAELERKNRELEKLRRETEQAKTRPSGKRDANDMTTWADHELKTVVNSNDPTAKMYKEQAEDILFDRRVARHREKEREQENRTYADLRLRKEYPEAMDPSSNLSLKIEEVMQEFDLQKSSAGRLAAAKIASAELNKGRSKSSAVDREKEKSRVARVKGQMVDGDRSKPSESTKVGPKKIEEIEKGIRAGSDAAFSDAMDVKGIRERFRKAFDR